MHVSEATIAILKNFMGINNSIYIDEPGYLKTMSAAGTIIAVAEIPEQFPEFAIYALNKFVPSLALLETKDMEFEFLENNVIKVKKDASTIRYRSSNPEFIMNKCKSADTYKAVNSFGASFSLTAKQINSIQHASKIMGLEHMKIEMNDGKGKVVLVSSDSSIPHNFDIDVEGQGTCDDSIDVKDLNLFAGEYDVKVVNGKAVKLENTKAPIFYFVSVLA